MLVSHTIALFDRQRCLLAILDALGGSVRNLDFQKLLFLYNQEMGHPAYEFVPYKYGAFSFSSYADRRKMVERGLLENDDETWVLSAEGRKAAQGFRAIHAELGFFARRYRTLRGDALIAETYRLFPYYATRSEVAARVLNRDAVALARIDAARPAVRRPALFTIGYEGRSLEGYLNRLLQKAVAVLCDVRRNPLSRKYGFSKKTLSNACEGVGIRYEHLPDLGISAEERQCLETQADYDSLFERYEKTVLPRQTEDLRRIGNWIRAGECVALTCFEHLPERCHRLRVARFVKCQLGNRVEVTHL
jgi:hypothetical protein